jgi:hypothetical protein
MTTFQEDGVAEARRLLAEAEATGRDTAIIVALMYLVESLEALLDVNEIEYEA